MQQGSWSTPPVNVPPQQPVQPTPRRTNLIKVALGCFGLGMFVCSGLMIVALIVAPIAYRSLLPEQQFQLERRLPFLAAFKPTKPPEFLPTVAATNQNALALLATPLDATPTLGSSGTLSAGGADVPVSTPTLLPTPTATLAATLPPTPSNVSPTPVIGQIPATPTSDVPTKVPAPTEIPIPVAFRNPNFKWIPQGWNNCGPANLAQALQYFGWKGDQDNVANFVKPNREDKNVSPWQLVEYTNSQTGIKALWRVAGNLNLIKRLTSQGFAVILETGYDVAGEGWMGHYLTVIGYDDTKRVMYGMDTYLGDGKDHQGYVEPYDDLERRWQQFNRAYIVLYTRDREAQLAAILGADADLTWNYSNALSVARTEASARPNNPYAWFNMGASFTLLGKYKEAVTAFDQAQSVGNLPYRFLWYQFTPYEAYYNTGNYQEVLKLAQTSLNTTPYVEETYYWRGMAYAAMGKSSPAVEDFKRVLRFNPNFEPASEMLTKIQSGKYAPPVVAQAGN